MVRGKVFERQRQQLQQQQQQTFTKMPINVYHVNYTDQNGQVQSRWLTLSLSLTRATERILELQKRRKILKALKRLFQKFEKCNSFAAGRN